MTPRIILDDFNLEAAQRLLCVEALATAGSIVEAAQLLGCTRHNLKRLIIKHRIEWPRGTTAPPPTETQAMITTLDSLRAQLAALDITQAEERRTAERLLAAAQEQYDLTIEPLDEARAPLQLAVEAALRAQREREDKAREALAIQRQMTLTPWRMHVLGERPGASIGDYGYRYLNGQEHAWCGTVAWLRRVTRDDRMPPVQWEVHIKGVGDIVYGPQSGESPATDFAKHALDVDARLTALGYYIADLQEVCERP